MPEVNLDGVSPRSFLASVAPISKMHWNSSGTREPAQHPHEAIDPEHYRPHGVATCTSDQQAAESSTMAETITQLLPSQS
jgi:hypothetical protein